ncbi:MAG: hypothetical protein WKF79_14925 [Nocardioides sp.]
MRNDGEFTAYAAARWTPLVRSLVLLGSPADVAPDIARAALARCRGDWSRRDELGDLDTHLYRTLLECRRADRREWWSRPADDVEADPDDRDMQALWSGLDQELNRLSEPERARIVLCDVADLSEEQAAAVVGTASVQAPRPPTDLVRQVSETIVVDPAPLDGVRRQAAADRARRRNRGVLVVAGLVGVAAAASLVIGLLGSPAPDPPATADSDDLIEVSRVDNLAPVGWYFGDTMHLDRVTLRIRGVREFATMGQGAVYLTTEGELALVDDDGVRTPLADLGEDGSFAVSDPAGIVAWITDGPAPELVVRDLFTRDDVLREGVGGDARVVAVDARSVSYVDGDGTVEIAQQTKASSVSPRPLLDARAAMRVFQQGPRRIFMEHRSYSVEFARAGVGAQLSTDGIYAITRLPDNTSRYDAVLIYDTRSGENVPTGLRDSDEVVDAQLGPDATVTYLIAVRDEQYEAQPPQMTRDAIFELRTCRLSEAYRYTGRPSNGSEKTCTTNISFPQQPGPLLLAR